MDQLIATAINVRTRADIDALESELVKHFGRRQTRYLGDNESNWSSVASGVDPRAIIFERVTNMWDAVIEAEARRHGRTSFPDPAAAAHELFGVPKEGLSELTPVERRTLAELCVLSVLDSDDPVRRPTIASRDKGIGLSLTEVPYTILSLERSNKLRKPYLHGVFGKGGSVACLFSEATIIITRKQPDLLTEGEEDRVTLAVVRQGDADDVGLPFFRYLVGPDPRDPDGLPYSVPASDAAEFDPGTLVIEVGYQAERMGRQQWQFEESLYAHAETLLFRPTLPYALLDQRSNGANVRPKDRRDKPEVVTGLGQRLDATDAGDRGLIATSRPATLGVPGVGDLKVRWWLFENSDHVRRRAAKGNVALFVANGQVHHSWDRARFRDLVEHRRRVSERIIVEVNTAQIPKKTRVRIFSSFRDTLLKSPEAVAVEDAVADWLSKEEDLDEAESKFTREALRAAGGRVSAALRRNLNRALKTKIPGLVPAQSGGRSGSNSKAPKPRPKEDLQPEPTALTGPESVEIVPGERKSFYLVCNAVDGFVPDTGELTISAEQGAPAFTYGIGDLRHGRLHASLLAPDEAVLGIYEVRAELSWMKAAGGFTTLGWPIKVKLVKKHAARKGDGGGKKRQRGDSGDVALVWDSPNEANEWDDSVVGELQEMRGDDLAKLRPQEYADLDGMQGKVTTIVLNEELPGLKSYLRASANQVGDAWITARKERYALAVGVTVARLTLEEEELRRKRAEWERERNGHEEPPKPMDEKQLKRALQQHAAGVLALLPNAEQFLEEVGGDGTRGTDSGSTGATPSEEPTVGTS